MNFVYLKRMLKLTFHEHFRIHTCSGFTFCNIILQMKSEDTAQKFYKMKTQ